MSNSNYENVNENENYRSFRKNDRNSFKGRSGGNKDGGGFRIRLSDNEMKAVKSIQETFQLKSTVSVLGFSIRTLSEMIKDDKLIESIRNYAKNNKNSSQTRQSQTSAENKTKPIPDPFARPLKSSTNEEDLQSNKVKVDEN